KVVGMSYGINGNMMYNQFGRFFLWQNHQDGAMKPLGGYNQPGGTISKDRYFNIYLDPHFSILTEKNWSYEFKGRVYHINRFRNGGLNDRANVISIDNQVQ